jgi:hypothetical protein
MAVKLHNFPIQRIWDAVEPALAADLVDDVLNDKDTEEALRLFAIGEIDSRELAYRIQEGFEAHAQKRSAVEIPHELEKNWEGT